MGFFGRKRAPSVPHPRKEPRFDGPLTLERLEQIFQDCVDFTKRPVSLGEGGACTLHPVLPQRHGEDGAGQRLRAPAAGPGRGAGPLRDSPAGHGPHEGRGPLQPERGGAYPAGRGGV